MEIHQDMEDLIDIYGSFAEKRKLRCRMGVVYHCVEVTNDMSMREMFDILRDRFKCSESEVICVSYSFNNGPFVKIKDDRDMKVMMRSQLRCRAQFIDVVVDRNVGGSGVFVGDTELEELECRKYDGKNDRFSQTETSQRLSCFWKDFIKGVDQTFSGGVKEFRLKLAMYAAEKGFEYEIIKNKPAKFTAVCKRKVEDMCLWRIHASVRKADGVFVIRRLNNEHSCCKLIRQNSNSELSSRVVTSIIIDEVRKKPGLTAKEVVGYIEDVYRFQVPYYTAHYALENAKKSVLGDGATSYGKLERYIGLLKKTNPGSHCVLECEGEVKRFRRVFISFDASIRGFQWCRPLVCLDGTFLSGKYKGTLLAAVGKDANQGIYLLAFAVVSAENNENWRWFAEQLRVVLDRYPRHISFVSDRNLGLVNAVREVFPNAPHAFCYNHMKSNLESKFPGPNNAVRRAAALKYFERCAYAATEERFWYNYDKLVAVDAIRVDACLGGARFSNWANAFFEGDRFGDVCSNVAESFNSWIRKERLLPVTELIDGIRVKVMRMMASKAAVAARTVTILTPNMEKELVAAVQDARDLEVIKASEAEFEVVDGRWSYVVNVYDGSCSCGEWRVNKFPCRHAASVYRRAGLNIYPFIDHVFSTAMFRRCYEYTVHPVVNDPYEIVDVGGPDVMLPPQTGRPAGRPPTRRKRSRVELVRQNRCSRCGKSTGHNKKTCVEPIN